MAIEKTIRFASSRRGKRGRRSCLRDIPSLSKFCTHVLIENIDAIEFIGEVPYFLLKPTLERCTAAQLFNIEGFNPYLVAETSDLWKAHCERDFRLLSRQGNETWRELYLRAHDEQEERLKCVTANNTALMGRSDPAMTDEGTIRFTPSRREETALYSGRRTYHLEEVPSLHEFCTNVLIENIDAIEFIGEVPYSLLKSVLERCTPVQLFNIEGFNPYLVAETSELWRAHCERDFRLLSRQGNETWRELYLRAHDEQEK